MKKILILVAVILFSLPYLLFAALDSTSPILGDGNINTLTQFTSTTSPSSAITQRTFGKALRLTGLTGCLEASSNGTVSSVTGAPCGSGSGGGADGNWVFFNGSGIRLATTSNQVVMGAVSTTTTAKLEVAGNINVRTNYITGTSYNQMIAVLANDSNWGFGGYNSGSTYWTKASYADVGDGLRGFSVVDQAFPTLPVFHVNQTRSYFRSGKVGIGTTTPYATLSVEGSSALGNSALAGYFTATTSTATSQFNGTIVVGTSTVLNSVDPGITISRSVNNSTSGNGHAFSDSSQVNRTGTIGYNSFDARIDINGSASYDHYAAFQTIPDYNSAGTMTNYYGLFAGLNRTAGVITNAYGVYVDALTGGTNNYGIYVEDNNSVFRDDSSGEGIPLTVTNNTGTDGTSATLAFNNASTNAVTGKISSVRVGSGNYALTFQNFGASGLFEFMRVNNSGNVGIGTTSPYAKLSVVGQVVGAYFTATTSTASTLPYASSTALTVSGALYNTSLSDGCLNVASGLIGSTGSACGSGGGGGSGIGWASTTIPNSDSIYSTQLSNVGIGSTSPFAKLSITNTSAAPSLLVEDSTSPDATSFLIDEVGQTVIGGATSTDIYTSNFIGTFPFVNRNDNNYSVGYSFTVKATTTVNRLGRFWYSTNSANHRIRLWDTSATTFPIMDVTVLNTATTDPYGFKWLATSTVQLVPSKTYAVGVDETAGGDIWADNWAVTTQIIDPNYSVIESRYLTGSGYPLNPVSAGQMYDSGAIGYTPPFKLGVVGTTTASAFIATGREPSYFQNASTTNISSITSSTSKAIIGVGSLSAPSLTISGDEDTGLYSHTANGIAFTTGGTQKFTIGSTGTISAVNSSLLEDLTTGAYTLSGALGTISLPTYSFTGDTNTGLWSRSADTLNLTAGGIETFRSDIASSSFPVGNLGVGTTSPYAKLSVVGEIVGSHFTATTTATSTFGGSIAVTEANSTSTFAGGVNLSAGCYAINGTCLSGSGGGGISGSGTDNYVAVWNGASSLEGTSYYQWDDTAKTLSISAISESSTVPVLTVGLDGGGSKVFEILQNANIILNSAGYNAGVGIGTSTPTARLAIEAYNAGGVFEDRLIVATNNVASGRVEQFSVSDTGVGYFATKLGIGSTSPFTTFDVRSGEVLAAQITNTFTSGNGLGVTIADNDKAKSVLSLKDGAGARELFGVGSTLDIDFGEVRIGANMVFSTDNAFSIGSQTKRPLNIYAANLASRGVLFSSTVDTNGLIEEDRLNFSWNDNTNVLAVANLTATTTNLGQGDFTHDYTTGTTTISSLETGAMSFTDDAGIISWIDLPVLAAPSGTFQSYSAQLDGIDMFTIFGASRGSGLVGSTGIGIGTTTPSALLHIHQNAFAASSTMSFMISSSTAAFATTTLFSIDNAGHKVTGGPAGSLSSCGTSPTIAGNDNNARVTLGTGVTGLDASCVYTFAKAWTTAPSCFVNNETRVLLVRAVTTVTTLTFDVAAFLTDSDVYNFHCEGY